MSLKILVLNSVLVVGMVVAVSEDFGGMSSLLSLVNQGSSRSGYGGGARGTILDGLDLFLTPVQAKALYGSDSSRTKRGGTLDFVTFWPDGVVLYTIEEKDFVAEDAAGIREAMAIIQRHTCIRFEEKRAPLTGNFILIQNGTSGCNSLLGMYKNTRQEINLLSGGCRHMGIYLHEIGHALGLLHEHQLPTRDQYVRFHPENMHPRKLSQLRMYDERVTDMYGTFYDLSSIMHYETTSGSVDGESRTLGVSDPYLERHIGRANSHRLSFGDVKILNKMYQCEGRCQRKPQCPEPGYVNQRCECVTPESYEHEICQDESGQTGWCEEQLKTGHCSSESSDMQRKCAKTCDLCPRFLPGQTALEKPPACTDHYVNKKKCREWAAAGDCRKYPDFMNQYCTESCNTCAEGHGKCPDSFMLKSCVEQKADCQKEGWTFVKRRCQATCGTCGLRREGECPNRRPDAECHRRMLAGECEANAIEMYYECPKSCNRCFFGAGDCNDAAGQGWLCRQYATLNYCLGGVHYRFMQNSCKKTCNKCPDPNATTTTTTTPAPITLPPGVCKNLNSEQFCIGWMALVPCHRNTGLLNGCKETCGLCK